MEQRRVVKFKDGRIKKNDWVNCADEVVIVNIAASKILNNHKNVESWYLEFREGGSKNV
jgi:hypothetical protein